MNITGIDKGNAFDFGNWKNTRAMEQAPKASHRKRALRVRRLTARELWNSPVFAKQKCAKKMEKKMIKNCIAETDLYSVFIDSNEKLNKDMEDFLKTLPSEVKRLMDFLA